MHVFKARSRMISVRLSEDEYLGLKRQCAITGARSVSHLAREAMGVLLKGGQGVDGLGARMDEFRTQMLAIERKIDDLPSRMSPSVKR
jgi:hypothetical protein